MLQTTNLLAIAFVSAAFVNTEINTRATAAKFPKHLYEQIETYTTNTPNRYGTADRTDIYYPVLSSSKKLVLLGHSHGGAVGLTAIDGDSSPIFCNAN